MVKKSLLAALAVSIMFLAFVFPAGVAVEDIEHTQLEYIKLEYEELAEYIPSGNTTYRIAQNTLTGDKAKLISFQEQYLEMIASIPIRWEQLSSLETQMETLEENIGQQETKLKTTLKQQEWQAKQLYLNHFLLVSKYESSEKAMNKLLTQRMILELKVNFGITARAALKTLDTQIEAQEKAISEAKQAIMDNQASLCELLGLNRDIVIGELPGLDITPIEEMTASEGWEILCQTSQSIEAQRTKTEEAWDKFQNSGSVMDEMSYQNASIQLEITTNDVRLSMESQLSGLQSKYESWKNMDEDINDLFTELSDLKAQYDRGEIPASKVTEKEQEISDLQKNKQTGLIELYIAMRKYEDLLIYG